MRNPNEHPWWNRVFAASWRGVLREACKAGLARAEAETLAWKLLDEARRELSVAGEEMTVAMFRRRLVQETRRQIAEALRGPRNPFHVSEAWREKYRRARPLVEDDTPSPEPVADGVVKSESAVESTPGKPSQCSEGLWVGWHVLGLVHVVGLVIKVGSQAWWLAGLVLILLVALVCWEIAPAGSEGDESLQQMKE